MSTSFSSPRGGSSRRVREKFLNVTFSTIVVGSGSSGNARNTKKVDRLNIPGGISDTDDLGSPEQEQEAIQVGIAIAELESFKPHLQSVGSE